PNHFFIFETHFFSFLKEQHFLAISGAVPRPVVLGSAHPLRCTGQLGARGVKGESCQGAIVCRDHGHSALRERVGERDSGRERQWERETMMISPMVALPG
uniref:Uncharacterized protein n=1 Tax=Esox lucius TaxID=8010 RepID=A0A3P8ZVS0_ESOLU